MGHLGRFDLHVSVDGSNLALVANRSQAVSSNPPAQERLPQWKCSCCTGVQPDTVTYNLALKACEAPANTTLAPGLLDTAFSLLRGMREQSVAPDVITYTTLLALCAQAGNGHAAAALYEVNPLLPHIVTCRCTHMRMTNPSRRHEHSRSLDMCFREENLTRGHTPQDIKGSGFKVDTALLNALISALGSAGLAQEALAVFRTMVRPTFLSLSLFLASQIPGQDCLPASVASNAATFSLL